jgi:hypothetical protein
VIYITTMNHLSYFKEHLSDNRTVTAYHGSPYRFSSFLPGRYWTSGQVGADAGIFFTTDKDVARRFARTFPNEMYDKIQQTEKEILDRRDQEIIQLLDDKGMEELFTYLREKDHRDAIHPIKTAKTKGDTKEMTNIINNGLIRFLGLRNLEKDSKDHPILKKLTDTYREHQKMIRSETERIKDNYENHIGSLYTVEIKTGKSKTIKGENTGVGIGRQNKLWNLEERGYDTVKITDADTGMGITDEIVVFNPANIRIIKVEDI